MREPSRAVEAIRARMTEMGVGPTAFAASAGVSDNAFRQFMRGGSWPIARTMAKIERGLGWPPGSIERIAEGEGVPSSDLPASASPVPVTAGEAANTEDEMLLRFPRGALDSLDPVEQEVVKARARLAVLEWLTEHGSRGGSSGDDQH